VDNSLEKIGNTIPSYQDKNEVKEEDKDKTTTRQRQGNPRQAKTRKNKTRQDKNRQDKTRQDKKRQDKTR
jgi:hypothetical protein